MDTSNWLIMPGSEIVWKSPWISVKDQLPKEGDIVVAWLSKRKEPACVRFERDNQGPLWRELISVDICDNREDLISHWMPLPELPPDE